MPNRKNSFIDAMRESLVQSMEKDKNVVILGEGVTDVKGIFNSTNAALKKIWTSTGYRNSSIRKTH